MALGLSIFIRNFEKNADTIIMDSKFVDFFITGGKFFIQVYSVEEMAEISFNLL